MSADRDDAKQIYWAARLEPTIRLAQGAAHGSGRSGSGMFFPVSEWFPAFVLTLVVELPIVLLVLRHVGVPPLRLAVLVVFANLATHPLVWFVLTQLYLVGTVEFVIVAESWAVGAEALFYAVAVPAITPRQAVVAAVTANVGSFVAGRLLNQALFVSLS